MNNSTQNKVISKLIFNGDILTLLIKDDYKDVSANGSINFIGTVYFYETGIVNQKIKKIDQGLLGFSSRNYVIKQNLEPNEFTQFYIDGQNDLIKTQNLELIVICKSIIISDNPYLLLPVS